MDTHSKSNPASIRSRPVRSLSSVPLVISSVARQRVALRDPLDRLPVRQRLPDPAEIDGGQFVQRGQPGQDRGECGVAHAAIGSSQPWRKQVTQSRLQAFVGSM